MQVSELLPCPFCGGEARADRGSAIAWVECRTPGCDGQQMHDELEDAIAAWNTRAKDIPQGDDVAIDVEQWVRSKPDDVREVVARFEVAIERGEQWLPAANGCPKLTTVTVDDLRTAITAIGSQSIEPQGSTLSKDEGVEGRD